MTLRALFLLLLPLTVRAADRVDFARDVWPVLESRCVRCHGPKRQEGGLRLDVRRRAQVGGDSGPAFVPGSREGEVIRRVTTRDEKLRMPPSGEPLTEKQATLIRAWSEQGADWPDALAGKEKADDHWAFRPVQRPAVPSVRGKTRNPVDAFLLARLEKAGRGFAAEADRRTLARRLHLDLLGLPPTPEEVTAFVKDDSADAYEKLVGRLMASPHFGERWGRHWLDLARFAESDGYENDRLRTEAWRFRDWVVDSFNADQPFDQFTVEQLAGDLLPGATAEQKVAAGFHRHTLWNSAASADKEEFRTLAVKDRTDTTGAVWMGLTLGCAQCHSHKYDPVSHREYYRLYAFFNRTDDAEVTLADGKSKAPTLKAVTRVTHVHRQGNFQQRGDEVVPGVPAFLPPLVPRGKEADRLDLARWLTDPRHPLTTRVAVNHVWQHLFGAGLVATPENLGLNGSAPTHPELIDWLAAEFVRLKWSRKALIRLIVTSSAYRQSSSRRGKASGDDLDNVLLGRQNRYRVEAEIVRDLSLSAAGLLSPKRGGPSIVPPFPEGLLEQKFTAEALKMPGGERHRRGIYVHVQRTLHHPTLNVFDGTDGNQSCPKRDRSVTPLQALTLLNDPVFTECHRALGKRLQGAGRDTRQRLTFGFEVCLARPPSARELAVLEELVATQQKLGASEDAVWNGVARTLLNLDEFITRE